jgi:chromosome segregation ATPase
MDVETSEAIEQLGRRIDALEASLRSEFRAGLVQLGSRFGGLESRFGGLESRFDGLESRFDGLESRFDRMETGLEARFAESRRHTDVLFESLRDDIRMLADGVATLNARLDAGRR